MLNGFVTLDRDVVVGKRDEVGRCNDVNAVRDRGSQNSMWFVVAPSRPSDQSPCVGLTSIQLTPSISVSSSLSFPFELPRTPTLSGIMYRPSSKLKRNTSRPVAPTSTSQLGA
jgi:hypothetical protein